jgi:hypothetical protein
LGQFLKKEASRKGAIGILNVITHTRPLPHNDLEKAALMAQVWQVLPLLWSHNASYDQRNKINVTDSPHLIRSSIEEIAKPNHRPCCHPRRLRPLLPLLVYGDDSVPRHLSKARPPFVGGLSPSLIRNRAIDRLKRLLNCAKGLDQIMGPHAGICE